MLTSVDLIGNRFLWAYVTENEPQFPFACGTEIIYKSFQKHITTRERLMLCRSTILSVKYRNKKKKIKIGLHD